MDFYFRYNWGLINNITVEYCWDLATQECFNNIVYIEKKKHLDYLSKDVNGKTLLKFGDVISQR